MGAKMSLMRIQILPCPFCGHTPDAQDEDFIYPLTHDKEIWGAHCPEPAGGCGASTLATSASEALHLWNTRASRKDPLFLEMLARFSVLMYYAQKGEVVPPQTYTNFLRWMRERQIMDLDTRDHIEIKHDDLATDQQESASDGHGNSGHKK